MTILNKLPSTCKSFTHKICVAVIEGDSMSFNVFGVQETNQKPAETSKSIADVELNNNNLKVVDFSVDAGTGISHSGYTLINIIIDVQILSDDIEKADQLLLFFDNGDVEAYDIGDMTIQNGQNIGDQRMISAGEYTVGYPRPSLDVNIKNQHEDIISLKKVKDLNKRMTYEFEDHIHIEPDSTANILITSFQLTQQYDFYTVTPIAEYSLNNDDYLYYMPGVLYGIMASDEEKIERIIQNHK
jgi:hypothetical protein